jgi:hypothetical protein
MFCYSEKLFGELVRDLIDSNRDFDRFNLIPYEQVIFVRFSINGFKEAT